MQAVEDFHVQWTNSLQLLARALHFLRIAMFPASQACVSHSQHRPEPGR